MSFLHLDPQLWSSETLQNWNVAKDVNPYQLDDHHPAAVLQIIYKAMKTFIIDQPDATKSGLYLRKIWRKCMIRRTYASPDPRFPSRLVGAAIANLFSRRIICNFDTNEHKWYMHFSEYPLSKLTAILPDGNLVWNRRHARQLGPNSSWIAFRYIGDRIRANTIEEWKRFQDGLLYQWAKLLHKKMEKENPDHFTLPEKEQVPQLLAIACRGSQNCVQPYESWLSL
jgi:hypothetical protein